jgi:hypothetical protein
MGILKQLNFILICQEVYIADKSLIILLYKIKTTTFIIKGILFNQETVKYLNLEQSNSIDSILKTALPNLKLGENTNHEKRTE